MAVELVSKGVQDAYLTGNPEVSFFRQMYKRHTNFAQRIVQLDPMGALTTNGEISLKIPNKGDLLGYIWLDLGSGTPGGEGSTECGISAGSDNPAIFELYIGGQLIDRQDATYAVQYWNKFLLDSSTKAPAAAGINPTTYRGDPLLSNWMPLHFFFCDSVYLPLVALQYHEVEVRIKFSANDDRSKLNKIKFYANYVLLDTDERLSVVEAEHELLIEQVQKISFNSNRADLSLLNHPVKCLLWGNPAIGASFEEYNDVQLYLNGLEIFGTPMPDKYFKQVQGYYHSDIASYDLANQVSNLKMYSFALKANKHQPCGTCNFSRIDTGSLYLGSNTSGLPKSLYAVNFNILRIKKGMAGVAFSN
jgi:hypothetical protein